MSQRKHTELWNELVDQAGEAQIDRAASVSVEQAESELRAAGFDVAAERAKANAFLEALERGAAGAPAAKPQAKAQALPPATEAPRPTSQPPARRPRPAFAWLAAAASFGAVAGGALVSAVGGPVAAVMAPHPPTPSDADLAAAADLRRQAAAACDAKQWSRCLAYLDVARAVDPRADDAPAVRALRDAAIAGILK